MMSLTSSGEAFEKHLNVDIAIVGAGLIGSAIAAHLPSGVSAVVLDADLSGELSSSELNAGGVRATWAQSINFDLSKRSIEFFERHADEVGYRSCGYLWIQRAATMDAAVKLAETFNHRGWAVDVDDVPQLKKRVPFIDKTADLAGAVFGRRDGLINPNALKEFLRTRAKNHGVQFVDRVWVTHAEPRRLMLHGVRLNQEPWDRSSKEVVVTEQGLPSGAEHFSIQAKTIINAAGAWAPSLARHLGAVCPSYPVRRQISLFQTQDLDLTPYGMIIDPSGVYFHPEATFGLAGFANADEPRGFNFRYDGDAFFESRIWANLYERSSSFERLKHVTGWSGLYETSPDHMAILGNAYNTEGRVIPGVYEAHSFSGHGAMQCVAVGQEIAELVLRGRYLNEETRSLSVKRFFENGTTPHETWVI